MVGEGFEKKNEVNDVLEALSLEIEDCIVPDQSFRGL